MSGYFLIYRGLHDHPLFQSSQPYSRFEAWVDLIEQANFAESMFRYKSQMFLIPRGSVGTSYRALAAKWRWSVNRVIREMNLWKSQSMVDVTTEHGYVNVTISNYEIYQNPHNTDGTLTEQQRNTDGTVTDTNQKKEKKEKKVKNLTYTAEFELFWQKFPRRDGSKLEAFKAYQSAIEGGTEHGRIIESTRQFASDIARKGVGQRYIPHATTWLNQRRWEADYSDDRPYLDGKLNQPSEKQRTVAAFADIIARRNSEADPGVQGQPEPTDHPAGTGPSAVKGLW